MSRRLECWMKRTEGAWNTLTVTDERITIKVGYADVDEYAAAVHRGMLIANRIPLGSKRFRKSFSVTLEEVPE